MKQNELAPGTGARKDRKRVGRGDGSGHGTYSGRGCNGQKSRSGYSAKRGFEGGQLPLIKRLPKKRGFHNMFRVEYSVVNLDKLNIFEAGSEVTVELLLAAGLVKTRRYPVKILSEGEIKHSLSVKVNKYSAAAKAKIEAAGGSVEEVLRASGAK